MKFSCVLIGLFFSLSLPKTFAKSEALGVNDVSFLLPLPKSSFDQANMLSLKTDDSILIPDWVTKEIPTLAVGQDQNQLFKNELKVVAIRLDPCFFEGTKTENVNQNCFRQIRMVWQPVFPTVNGFSTRDAALHSFYELTSSEWESLLNELQPLRIGNSQLSVTLHPKLQKGYQTSEWKIFKSTILKYASEKNLSRVTFMSVNPVGTVWVFGGFEINSLNRTSERINIPKINFMAQGFFISRPELDQFRSEIRPTSNDKRITSFLLDSSNYLAQSSEKEIRETIAQFTEFENPKKHNPGTLDCVSCHVSSQVVNWAEQKFPQMWQWPEVLKSVDGMITTQKNLMPTGRQDQLRSFGYFANQPVISRRVQEESEMSATH